MIVNLWKNFKKLSFKNAFFVWYCSDTARGKCSSFVEYSHPCTAVDKSPESPRGCLQWRSSQRLLAVCSQVWKLAVNKFIYLIVQEYTVEFKLESLRETKLFRGIENWR